MKLLFFNTNIGYGGASKMMVYAANIMSKSHDVTFLTYRSNEIKQNLDTSVKFEYNPLFKNKHRIIEIFGHIYVLHRYLKKNKFDVILSFLPPSNYIAVLAAIGTKTKVLLSERGDPYSRLKNGGMFIGFLEKILHKADAYVFQSEEAASAYPYKCIRKGAIIPNAISKKNFPEYNPNNENKYIICVARIELIQKRQDVLVDAFYIFLKSHPEYILLFVGDGPDEGLLKEKVSKMDLEKNVKFLGARNDALELVAKSMMFVLPSDYEGMPNALLEAMAIGVPCISTDFSPGGVRKIIENGINGYIVPRGNPLKMAEKMAVLGKNDDIRHKFSHEAKKVIEKFSPNIVESKWNEFIGSLGGM